MQLSPEELETAERNRRYMRHMTLSFWGFILVSVAVLFIWNRVLKYANGETALAREAVFDLWVEADDQAFWTHKDTDALAEQWAKEGVRTVYLPIWTQNQSFFNAKAVKYVIDNPPAPLEYQRFKEPVVPRWTKSLKKAGISIATYFDFPEPNHNNNPGYATQKAHWFDEQTGLPSLEADSLARLFAAIAEEAVVHLEADQLAFRTHVNAPLFNQAFVQVIQKAVERRKSMQPTIFYGQISPKLSLQDWLSSVEAGVDYPSQPLLIFAEEGASLMLFRGVE